MKYLLITVSLLFASQAMAQDKKKSERAQPAPSSTAVVNLQQDFSKADADANGGISITELTNIKDDYEEFNVEEIFQLLDKNGDGILNPTEFNASAEALRKRPGKLNSSH